MQLEELVIPLKVDKAGFTGGLDNATKMLTNFAKVAALAVAAAAVVVGKFLLDSTKLASDLAETVSKVGIVFGDSAKEITDWAKTSATALGMSKNSALAAAATYGNLFRAMGITEKASAKMSKGLVNLAGDLASFNNMNPTEVLDKLRAGLSGETEPLRALGVNLNQAVIEAKALELGLWDGNDAIDAAAKAQASYALIMEQTTLAQGDFARTSEGLANQQRILAAQWEDMKTTLGAAFLPLLTKSVSKLNEFVKILGDPDGLDMGKIAAWVDKAAAGIIDGMAVSILRWSNGGGPEKLSESLISWVEGIGDSSFTKSKIQIAMEHLVIAMGEALSNVDWSGIGTAIDTKLDEAFAVMEPAIRTGLDGIDADFNAWLAGDNGWDHLDASINEAVNTAMQNAGVNFKAGLQTFKAQASVELPQIAALFSKWAADVLATYNAWASNVNSEVNAAINTLKGNIDSKLRDIAKTFFNRAAAWAQQMLQGFVGSQGSLFSAISSMVATINGLLRKIITSFHLTITYSDPTGSMGGGNRPRPGAGTGAAGAAGAGGIGGTGVGGQYSQFASGGSFVVPSQYGYEGFGMGGIATASAGELVTISPNRGQQNVVATIDEGRLARVIVQALMQAGFSG